MARVAWLEGRVKGAWLGGQGQEGKARGAKPRGRGCAGLRGVLKLVGVPV